MSSSTNHLASTSIGTEIETKCLQKRIDQVVGVTAFVNILHMYKISSWSFDEKAKLFFSPVMENPHAAVYSNNPLLALAAQVIEPQKNNLFYLNVWEDEDISRSSTHRPYISSLIACPFLERPRCLVGDMFTVSASHPPSPKCMIGVEIDFQLIKAISQFPLDHLILEKSGLFRAEQEKLFQLAELLETIDQAHALRVKEIAGASGLPGWTLYKLRHFRRELEILLETANLFETATVVEESSSTANCAVVAVLDTKVIEKASRKRTRRNAKPKAKRSRGFYAFGKDDDYQVEEDDDDEDDDDYELSREEVEPPRKRTRRIPGA